MKKALTAVVAVVLVGGLASIAAAGGSWGRGYMMGDRDYAPGQHMYGRDYDTRGYGPGYCWGYGDRFRESSGLETADQAAEIVGAYLRDTGNPNLQVGKVTESGRDFQVEIVTKDGSLADKVLVEKATGRIFPAYNG